MVLNPVAESESLSQWIDTNASRGGERYLGCHLVPNLTVVMPVHKITEVLTIPTPQVTPIPHLSSWVMGVYNWRGDVLWMVDLGHLLGLTPWYQQTANRSVHSALVVRTQDRSSTTPNAGQKMLGLVVSQIRDIETLEANALHSPSSAIASPELAPFLQGHWLRQDGELLAFLDIDAIFSMIAK